MTGSAVTTDVLRDFLAAFNAHDLDAIMAFFTEDCVFEMPRGPAPGGRRLVGLDEVREGIRSRLGGIPDVRYDDDRHWVCGDRGVSEWIIRGTQRTGAPIEVRGCDLFEFSGGRISRKDSYHPLHLRAPRGGRRRGATARRRARTHRVQTSRPRRPAQRRRPARPEGRPMTSQG